MPKLPIGVNPKTGQFVYADVIPEYPLGSDIIMKISCRTGISTEAVEHILDVLVDEIGWDEIHAFQDELAKGQDMREDAGGFFLRAIRALFGKPSRTTVENYRQAVARLLEEARARNKSEGKAE